MTTTTLPRHRRVIDTAIEAIRKEIIAFINTTTAEWGASEGFMPKELTPQAVRDDRMSNLVHTISKEVGSSVGRDALYSLVDAIVGRQIPRVGGPFATMPVGGAFVSSGRLFVITTPSTPTTQAGLIQVENGSTNSMGNDGKPNVTLPGLDQLTAAIQAASATTVLAMYDAFNKAAANPTTA